MDKTFDELFTDYMRTVFKYISLITDKKELEQLRIEVLGKKGIFKQMEKALWKK